MTATGIVADAQGIFPTLGGFIPSPFDNPQVWDSFTAQGQTWTGKIKVRRARRAYKWDVKNPAGQEGQNQNYRGREFPPFELVFYFWDTDGWNAWQLFSQNFIYFADKTQPKAITVYHPALAAVEITQALVEDVGAPEEMNEGGEYSAKVTLREFKPIVSQNVTSTPTLSNTIPEVTLNGYALTPAQVAAEAALTEELRLAGQNGFAYQGNPASGLP